MSVHSENKNMEAQQLKSRYFLTWRWHFYAGLFVVPFLLMLSLTGLVMLFDQEIETARYGDIIKLSPETISHETSANTLSTTSLAKLSLSEQLNIIQQAFPTHSVTQFIPAKTADVANRFSIKDTDGKILFATINPYNGEVLGTIDRSDSWYQLANDIHGTLLIGDWGDHLIEVAASLCILLLVSGIYLWLPFDNASKAGFLKIRTSNGPRIFMRDLHANLGGTLSFVFLFFILSGLAWAGVWGGKMVQAWSTFPAQKWDDVPLSTQTHQSLNHLAEEELPWNLEQTPLPASNHDHSKMGTDHASSPAGLQILDRLEATIHQLGYTHYKLHFPRGVQGVFTVSANTMSGDIIDPTQDRTTHIDQYSGEILADVSWDDYGVMAKMMAAGIALHQGDISILNKIFNVLFCVMFIVISVTGAVMWWIRRPKNRAHLGVPPRFTHPGTWKTAAVTLSLICLAFPLAGVTIVLTLLLDWFLFSRFKSFAALKN
ncbi:PepSY domain-containing protein [Vibrio sp. YMD68]|uniref:PepSY-associated TM helix domain-containing protein n=1 Tax=Vibrio sp. YMD68 TaxID=3042300 RepID=UPI00249AC4DA|nr:PepSY domain-containing protein [Vibrio sp. YMD68]WGV98359.1 PepSY domain-containing protein [Vibrio sp. YMD68]